MGVNLVLRIIIAAFALGAGMIIFMPILYTLAYDESLWTGKPASVLERRDQVYNILFALPLWAFGALVLWSYMEASRKSPYESYT